ncbi:MAG: DUF1656 domain-containing protein [Verrucomicrobia bacterium]|nr:DUF1656 domain-containing protein [Verrucomicrobiota bacterium]
MNSIMPVPHEVSFDWVYFPPLLFSILFGVLAAWGLAVWLNRTRLSRYFWQPPIAFLAFVLIFSAIFALFIMAP